MNPEMQQAWSEILVDHSQFPRRHGRLGSPTHEGRGENPFCGDRIALYLEVDGAGVVGDVRFEATGCAISTASASLLAENLHGLTLGEARALFDTVHAMLTKPGDGASEESGELAALQMVRRYPARVKCATLAWHVLRNALDGDGGVATTE